jgi:hypothetical protein
MGLVVHQHPTTNRLYLIMLYFPLDIILLPRAQYFDMNGTYMHMLFCCKVDVAFNDSKDRGTHTRKHACKPMLN